jgi:phospholipid/cholesterol/gamma-HCH transport system substrate-binding protein/paraquat-inducible protein B
LGTDLRSIARKLDQVEFEKITKDLDSMITSVTQLVKSVQVEQLGTEAKQVMTELRGTIQDARRVLDNPHLAKTFKDSSAAMEDFRRAAGDLNQTAKNVRIGTDRFPDLVTRLSKTLRRADTLLAAQGEKVDDVLENLRTASEELRYLTKAVEQYPSQVLFGEPPPRSQAVKR